jgi:hypothetical protein
MDGVNLLAVLVAAISSFMLGGLWYSPVMFLKLWNHHLGRGDDYQGGHPAKVFGISFLMALIAAYVFAVLLGPQPPLDQAIIKGALVGGAIVATSFGINYQFADRSPTLWLIDGGYHLVQFVLYGLILGLWH